MMASSGQRILDTPPDTLVIICKISHELYDIRDKIEHEISVLNLLRRKMEEEQLIDIG
jgi:hypothetical protein